MISEHVLSGLLLSTFEGDLVSRGTLLRCADLRNDVPIGGTHWGQVMFYSPKPLAGEEDLTLDRYAYPIIYRLSGTRILLLSRRRSIIEGLNDIHLSRAFKPALHPVQIAVDSLVRAIVDKPEPYVLSFVHARLAAFGTSLRSVSFYGDDVADANMFRQNVDLFNCHTCGLRSASGGAELVRIGNDGSISFSVPRTSRYIEVEQALGFVSRRWFLGRTGMADGKEFPDHG